MRWSFDDSDPDSFGFHQVQDVVDSACQIAQRSKDWHAAQRRNLAKRYSEQSINVVVTGRFSGHSGNYDLVFSSVPFGPRVKQQRIQSRIIHKGDPLYVDSRLHDGAMFVGVSDLVQSPQGRIPTLVRLELHDNRLNLIGDKFGFAFEVPIKLRFGITEREIGFLPRLPRNNGARAMIKSRSHVFDGRNGELCNSRRKSSLEFYFVDVINAISIKLGDSFVCIGCKKIASSHFQISDVLICPTKTFGRTQKLAGYV